MRHTDRGSSQVWRHTLALLNKRRQRKWDSFSWIALRPVISSLNHKINDFAPTLVGDLRQQWVNRQAAADLLVDKSDCSSFILLGDPGEQDASQYVVVPALQEQAAGAYFMVICSDVIYPSGDVNDYVDGLYVPYKGLTDLPILAIPGNHDWYDVLTGFMWHFCGADPLPASAYRVTKGTPLREWPARLLWRRPSTPDPHLKLEQLRAGRAPAGQWAPLQPGPYYAIETEHVLLVCIDSGIDGRIDRVQGEWLLRISTHLKPKVLLTGKPLIVDRQRRPCVITGGPISGPSGTDQPFDSVAAIVEHPPHRYVATIGGDVHNFQRYQVGNIEHIVSGGGGAYMTATHAIRSPVEDPCAAQPDAPAAVQLFPSQPGSLRHFARLVLPRLWRLVRALIAVLAGVSAAAIALTLADSDRWAPQALLCSSAALAGFVGLRLFVIPAAWTRTASYRLGVVVAAVLAGTVIVALTWWLDPEHALRYVLAWAGLTAGGGVLAWLLRLTGWWRPPSTAVQIAGLAENSRWLRVIAALFVLAPIVSWLILHDGWLTGAAAVTAVAAVGGWRLRWRGRPPRPRCSWKAWAPPIAYIVQVVDAVVLLDRFGVPGLPRAVWGVGAGLLAVGLVTALAMLVLCALMPLGIARAGQLYLLVAGGLWAVWACCGGDTGFHRAAFITAVLVVGTIAVVFGVDALRRVIGQQYKIVAPLIAAGVFLRLWDLGAFGTWLPRASATAAIVIAMSVIGVVIVHLMFLGAFTLIGDAGTHRVGEQFTPAEAESVIAWRSGGEAPTEARVRRRANIVFPASDQPRGPIQSAVSEIFDSDRPPFIKNFLVVTSDPQVLTITTHVVTGEDEPPQPYELSIPLSAQ